MLSEYIKSKEAFVDSLGHKLTLTYLSEPLVIDKLPPSYSQLESLILNHCRLASLEGIEQFINIKSLTIKHNNIEEIEELYRIKNKEKIKSLSFQGNSIQYCAAGLFTKLKEVFPNLEEVNGKDYSLMIQQKKGEKHGMKTILRKAQKMQKELSHLIEKKKPKEFQPHKYPVRRTFTQKEDIYSDSSFKQTRPTKRKVCNQYGTQERSYGSQEERSSEGEEIIQTTQKKSRQSYDEESVLKENKNWNNIDNDISLGGISNIPMTKSIRASMVDKPKKKGLQIFTLDDSLQGVHRNLAQPTATFAMQRQKEETNNFVFKNKSKRYQTDEIPLQQYQSKYEYERPTKRQTLESEDEPLWEDSKCEEQNLMEMVIARVDEFYYNSLCARVFQSLKNLPKKRNLPMKLNFQ